LTGKPDTAGVLTCTLEERKGWKALLSDETELRIALLFPPQQQEQARDMLQKECGNNLPFMGNLDAIALERVRFAALKLSGGDLGELTAAIRLAKEDWRDLLMVSGFGHDPRAHKTWLPEKKW
jgi:hypothetical protein